MLDAHCHLDRYKNPVQTAKDSAARGVFTIAVTNLPSHFLAGFPHVRLLKRVRLALGLHPLAAANHERERKMFHDSLHMTSFVGEVGLDFSREVKDTRDTQMETFRFVVKSVATGNKFISLHSRNAESAVLDILTEFNIRNAIFHWYSGPLSILDEIASKGHFFSVNPTMTSSEKGRRIISRIPPDRLLTETDGPYAMIDRTPANPWDILQIEKHLSGAWTLTPEDVRNKVWGNFREILSRLNLLNTTENEE